MQDMETKRTQIEQPNKEKFFTKKKIILFSIAVPIFILIIYLTYTFLLDINFKNIGTLLSSSYETSPTFFAWVFLLILFPIYNCLFRVIPYWYKLRKRKIFVEWYNWILFCFITFFIAGITPFSMGYEPFIIYWLKKRGLDIKEATAIVATFTVINPYIQIIITWPSFFVLCKDYHNFVNNMEWLISFWAIFVALLFDICATIFWTLVSNSKNFHYLLNLVFNWLKKLIHLNYKTKEQIKFEFKEKAIFKKIFKAEMSDYKYIALIVMGSLIWNIFYYCTLIVAFKLLAPNSNFNFGDLFNYVNVASTANNYVPIPGAEGTLQLVLSVLIKNSSNNILLDNKQQLTLVVNNSIFIWRVFTFYSTTIIGLIALVLMVLKTFYKFTVIRMKHKKGITSYTHTFIIRNLNNDLYKTLNSIKLLQYDLNLINIIILKDKYISKKILKEFSFLNIKIINSKNKNLEQNLKLINKKRWLKNDLINVINSGDIYSYNILNNLNIIYHQYDIYASQYKNYDIKKTMMTRSPFFFLWKKRLYDFKQMSTPLFIPCNFFFSTKLIKKVINKKIISYDDINFYNKLIHKAKNLRYQRRLHCYQKINVNNQLEKTDIINSLKYLNQTNPELVCYLLANKRNRSIVNEAGIKFDYIRKPKFNWLPRYLKIIFIGYYKIKIKPFFVARS